MTVLDELSRSCERRGLRLLLTGSSRDGNQLPGMLLDGLEVRDRDGELVARVPVDGLEDSLHLEVAAFELAHRYVELADE